METPRAERDEAERCEIGEEQAPVTTVIARRVRRGKEREFEAWLRGIIEEARRFEGHEGATVLRPRTTHVPEYLLIMRFCDESSLTAWLTSPERAAWIEKSRDLTESVSRHQQVGLETWFTLPGEEVPIPPPPWKMALLSWLAIYPLVTLINLFLVPFLEHEHLPLAFRTLVMTVILIPTMTWVVMPRMTRLFWRWLYPGVPRR